MGAGLPWRILLVEDDYLHEEAITAELKESIPGVLVEALRSECDFHQRVEQIDRAEETPPDLIILDHMIRWALPDPKNECPMPAEWEEEGTLLAGVRCEYRISKSAKLYRTPVIVFTILEEEVLNAHPLSRSKELSIYLRKANDLRPLCELARRVLGGAGSREGSRSTH